MTGPTRLMSAAPRRLQTLWLCFQFQGGTSYTVVSRFASSEIKIRARKEDLWGAEPPRFSPAGARGRVWQSEQRPAVSLASDGLAAGCLHTGFSRRCMTERRSLVVVGVQGESV